MGIGKRIRELRKNILKLNQTDFAAPLGLNQSTIGGYENDFRSVSDATILAICRQYGVNEEWLRNGTGEIFTGSSIAPSDLSELTRKYDLDKYDQALIMEYMKLEKPIRERLKRKIREIFLDDDIDQEAESYPGISAGAETDADRIDREVADYRRQLELEARQAGELSASGDGEAEKGA